MTAILLGMTKVADFCSVIIVNLRIAFFIAELTLCSYVFIWLHSKCSDF